MSKISMMRFFVIVVVLFCIGPHVSAVVYKLQGPGSKRIVFDKNTFDYKIDYSKTYAFYNTTDKYKEQPYELNVGDCKIEFMTRYCRYPQVGNRDHNIRNGANSPDEWKNWDYYHDDFPFGTVKASSISFHAIEYIEGKNRDHNLPCNANFDSSSGKYEIDVSLTGEVSPDLVVNFFGEDLTTTTSTTTSKPTTLPTSTPDIILPTVKSPCPQCEKRGIEAWLIGLIVAIVVLALLAIILCAVLFCCYRRMQKAKAQKIVLNGQTTVKSTVSTAPGPLVKETNLSGPDMMYFGRDATPVDPNAKSQAVNPAPQAISPAPFTSPMQAP